MISSIKPKKLKKKRCKECGEYFDVMRPLQFLCKPACAIAYTRKHDESKRAKEWNVKKKEWVGKLKTKSDYEKDLEKEVNHIVRLIDYGHECISSGRSNYVVNAGHYWSVGSHPAVRFNLLNIFGQSVGDNKYKGGQPREYKEGLRKTFGFEVTEEIEGLKLKYKELHLSIPELKETIKVARQCVRELIKEEKIYTTEERIELRRKYNLILNIYG